MRRSLKLRHVGTVSAASPRAKNSTSPVVFPVEDTHGMLRLVREVQLETLWLSRKPSISALHHTKCQMAKCPDAG